MLKKFLFTSVIAFLCSFIVFPNCLIKANTENMDISAKSYILIEKDTKNIIASSNENEKLPMASTTKIMTTILALESGNLNEHFKVEEDWVKVEGSSMGLLGGDTVTMLDLCYGMMLPSGNDSANVVAMKLAGSLENFATMMNEKAKEIGMKNTNFTNPSGLYNEKHYSTAFDMAILTRYALNNPKFKEICSTDKKQLEFGNPPYKRTLTNHNRLLKSYDNCIGVKTGFTKKAGRCLVSAVEKDGITLIAVTLNAPNDWKDHTKLFDFGFDNINTKEYYLKTEDIYLDVVGGKNKKVKTEPRVSEIKTILNNQQINNIHEKIIVDKFLYAPVKKGDIVGKLQLVYKDNIIKEIDLLSKENIDYKSKVEVISEDKNWLQKLIQPIKDWLVF